MTLSSPLSSYLICSFLISCVPNCNEPPPGRCGQCRWSYQNQFINSPLIKFFASNVYSAVRLLTKTFMGIHSSLLILWRLFEFEARFFGILREILEKFWEDSWRISRILELLWVSTSVCRIQEIFQVRVEILEGYWRFSADSWKFWIKLGKILRDSKRFSNTVSSLW